MSQISLNGNEESKTNLLVGNVASNLPSDCAFMNRWNVAPWIILW